MSLSKHTIYSGPTTSRDDLKLIVVERVTALPVPTRLGQLCYINTSSSGTYTAKLYVAVTVDGFLTWKRAQANIVYIDRRTGQLWDPLVEFYDTKAT